MGRPKAQVVDESVEPTKASSLTSLIAALDKEFGAGTAMRLSGGALTKPAVISTGSLGIDAALGIGGLPRGRIVEIYGPESSGKTTLTLHIMAEAQKLGLQCAFVDAEHALDPAYATALGVDLDNMILSQPDNGEQALTLVERFISSQAIHLVIVDSVAALVPKAELEGDMGDAQMGKQARLMSQAMRKLTAAVAKSQAILVFINQTRSKIGVMWGSPETTTGGAALKFYASVRLDIRRIGSIKEGERAIGNRTRVKVVKNKLAPPFKETEFDILWGKGISRAGELVDLAAACGALEKSGAWFSFKGERMAQGRPKMVGRLEEDLTLFEAISVAAKERIAAGAPVVVQKEAKEAIQEAEEGGILD